MSTEDVAVIEVVTQDDQYEPNDTQLNAYSIVNNEKTWLSSIDGMGIQKDTDWYKIYVNEGFEKIQIDLRFSHANGDIDIKLYNSLGTSLISSLSVTDDEFIGYTVPREGFYYLKIYSYLSAQGNSYDLWWDDLAPNIISTDTQKIDFVARFYQNILNRPANQSELDSWVSTMQASSGANVALNFFNSPEFINRQLNNTDFITILYQTLFNRAPDQAGLKAWLSVLESGKLREMVLYDFLAGEEFNNLTANFGITSLNTEDSRELQIKRFVERFYQLVLNRDPDRVGFNDWSAQLANPNGTRTAGDIARGFFQSPEFINQRTSNSQFLNIAYQAFFDRAADIGGKQNWMTKMSRGTPRLSVISGFIGSQEFINLANSFGIRAD